MKITDGTRQRALVAMEALDDRLAESSNDVAIISRQKQKFIVAMERAFYFFFCIFFCIFSAKTFRFCVGNEQREFRATSERKRSARANEANGERSVES